MRFLSRLALLLLLLLAPACALAQLDAPEDRLSAPSPYLVEVEPTGETVITLTFGGDCVLAATTGRRARPSPSTPRWRKGGWPGLSAASATSSPRTICLW